MNTIKMIKKLAAVAIAAVTFGFAPSAWATERECVQLWADGPYFATCNIGAESPEEYGYYFWWGDTVGYTNTMDETKANSRNWISVKDGKTKILFSAADKMATATYGKDVATLQGEGWLNDDGNLVLSDDATVNRDAARAHWGSSWRMMTDAELQKLVDTKVCTSVWISVNGVYGRKVFGVTEGYTDKSIFLPAAGQGANDSITVSGNGRYFTSTPSTAYQARQLRFVSTSFNRNQIQRYNGCPIRPVCDTPPVTPVAEDPAEEPAVEELVLWEGEAVVDDWNDPVTGSQPALITGGGAVLQNAGAYVGQEIRFYITPTGEWNEEGYENWWCDIVGGNWEGVYVQRCAPGCYNDDDPNRMEWDLDANGGYISFTLTQEMLDAAYRKGEGTGVFVANGNDAIITKIALVDPKAPVTPVEPVEEHPAIDPDLSVYPYYWDDGMVLWEGEVLADEWKNSPYFFVNNAVEVMDAEGVSAKEGDEIRFYITPTEWSWACEIWKGDWSGIYVSYNSDEWDLEANGGYISLTLTQEMLEFAYTKESWSGLFIANADNVVVTKIVHVRNGEGGGESGGGDIGGGEGGGTTPEEPEVKDYPAYIPDDEGVKAKYDAWVEAFCISDRIDADAALQNAYLLNVAPADAERAMAEFRITSITVNADGTVTITTPEGKNYNGTVEIIGAETLDGDYTAAKVWYNTARFFKAILK